MKPVFAGVVDLGQRHATTSDKALATDARRPRRSPRSVGSGGGCPSGRSLPQDAARCPRRARFQRSQAKSSSRTSCLSPRKKGDSRRAVASQMLRPHELQVTDNDQIKHAAALRSGGPADASVSRFNLSRRNEYLTDFFVAHRKRPTRTQPTYPYPVTNSVSSCLVATVIPFTTSATATAPGGQTSVDARVPAREAGNRHLDRDAPDDDGKAGVGRRGCAIG